MGRETRDTIGRLNPETGAPTLILQEIEFLEEKKNRKSSRGKLQEQQGWDAAPVLVEFYYQLFLEREGGDGSIKEFMSNKDEFIR